MIWPYIAILAALLLGVALGIWITLTYLFLGRASEHDTGSTPRPSHPREEPAIAER